MQFLFFASQFSTFILSKEITFLCWKTNWPLTIWDIILISVLPLFIILSAFEGEVEYFGNISDEPMAECKTSCYGRLGWRRFSFSRFTALRRQSGWYYNIRSWSYKVWNARKTCSWGRIWLGLLWKQGAHSLLGSIR